MSDESTELRNFKDSHLKEFHTHVAKTEAALTWHKWIIGIAFGLIIGIGIYRIVLDPHPVTTDHPVSDAHPLTRDEARTVRELSSGIKETILVDVRERLIESVRQLSFTDAHNRKNRIIQRTVRYVKDLDPMFTEDAVSPMRVARDFADIVRIVDALEMFTSIEVEKEERYSRIAEAMRSFRDDSEVNSELKLVAKVLEGIALSLPDMPGKPNNDATEVFEEAVRDMESGIGEPFGAPYNGLGIQRYYQMQEKFMAALSARDEVGKDALLREARGFEKEARAYFQAQSYVDNSLISKYKLLNNIALVENFSILMMLEMSKLGAHFSPQEFEARFDSIERNIELAFHLQPNLPAILSSKAECASARGDYHRQILEDDTEATRHFGESKKFLIRAFQEGLFGGDSAEEKKAKLDRYFEVKAMLDERTNRQEVFDFIDRL